jgi:hypothetical protein
VREGWWYLSDATDTEIGIDRLRRFEPRHDRTLRACADSAATDC